MSAEQGWIGDPQPQEKWHENHYSRMLDTLTDKPHTEETYRHDPKEGPQ